MNETDLIDRLRPLAGPGGLDLRDDAALLTVAPGQQLVMSTDTMVEGVHFPRGRIGGGFSERLLRTALSDLAAKAARPVGYTLNVTWPRDRDARWLDGFVRGLSDAQSAFDCPLLGGDTTSSDGPLVASANVFGVVPEGCMVLRSGACAGDLLIHSGVLGRAEQGLRIVQGDTVDLSPEEFRLCEEAYLRPEPRFSLRRLLRDHATAAADISDGLLSEAGHIARASGVRIDVDARAARGASFGDDYEILFTAPEAGWAEMQTMAHAVGIPLAVCGRVSAGEGVWVDGAPAQGAGFRHEL